MYSIDNFLYACFDKIKLSILCCEHVCMLFSLIGLKFFGHSKNNKKNQCPGLVQS